MVHVTTIAALAALLSSASASCLHGTILAARAADGLVPISTFNYTGEGGPLNWYGLNTTTNSACSMGKFQSPIDINTKDIGYTDASALNVSVPAVSSAKFENLGTNVEVVVNGSLIAGNTTYTLAQFHFHTPSEHRINEEYFPMEVHFVYQTSDGDVAVVAFLFQLSQFGFSEPLFDSVFAHIDAISSPGTFTETGPLDFTRLVKHFNSHGAYSYNGSLTTPPCSENVAWYISTEPLKLNVQTYNAVKKVVKFNARYTQNNLGSPNLLQVGANSTQ